MVAILSRPQCVNPSVRHTYCWYFHGWPTDSFVWHSYTAIRTPYELIRITVTLQWAAWRLKSPASGLFAQAFVQAHIKGSIKALRHRPLWGEFTIKADSPHKGPVTRQIFPFDDVTKRVTQILLPLFRMNDLLNHPFGIRGVCLWHKDELVRRPHGIATSSLWYTDDCHLQCPLLLTWFNFNPSMDK